MVEAAVAPSSNPRAALLRKLHSLSGVVPLGAFLLLHLWTTASIGSSQATYDRQVGFLHGGPFLGFLELVLVLVPLAYHGLYGIIRSLSPRDVNRTYDSDLMVVLQRVSGAVVLVFVVLHVWEFRVQTWTSGLPVASYSTKLVSDLSSTQYGVPWIALGTIVGSAASLFHLVNGMTSFCNTWGFATNDAVLRRLRLVFRTFGILFFVVSAALVVQVATGSRVFPAEQPGGDALLCGSAVPSPSAPPSAAPSASVLPSPSR